MTMTKGRKTTLQERIDIVTDHIGSGLSYAETAEKYDVSYQQVYQWIQKYKANGVDGLVDRRGRTKPVEEMTDNYIPDVADYVNRNIEYRETPPLAPPVVPTAEQSEDMAVLDAWPVENIKNNTTLWAEVIVTRLPEDGSLFARAVKNGALAETAAENLAVGDRVAIELSMKGAQGIALATDGEGEIALEEAQR